MKLLNQRAEDAENRTRRNNVRIIGLREGAEGLTPADFTENLLKELLAPISLSTAYTVEGANKIPTRQVPEATPRPFILRLLNYRDRDAILLAAGKKGKFNTSMLHLWHLPKPTITSRDKLI